MIIDLSAVARAFTTLSIYLWRKPNMDLATINGKTKKIATAAAAAATTIAQQKSDLAAKDVTIADLQSQLGGQGGIMQEIADECDVILAALPDAPA